MKKRSHITLKVIAIVLCAMVPLAISLILHGDDPVHRSIFNDIQELKDALSPYVVDQVDDPAVRKLEYTQAVQWIVEKDGERYIVCGYTFPNRASAQRYRSKGNGKGNEEYNLSRSEVYTYLHTVTEYTAVYEKNALYIKGKNYDKTVQFLNWLEPYLSIKDPGGYKLASVGECDATTSTK